MINPTTRTTQNTGIASLNTLISFLTTQPLNHPKDIIKAIKGSNIQEKDLDKWQEFNHSLLDSYGRSLVYKNDHVEVMVMSWDPGDFSAIHDHGNTQWGAVKVFGFAEHAAFRHENDRLSTLSRKRLKPGDIIGVNQSLIHQMGNPTDSPFVSLHVYGTPNSDKGITEGARIFELHKEKILRVNGGVFYALNEAEIVQEEQGPKGDFPTWLRHMVELARRLKKMNFENDMYRVFYLETIEQLFKGYPYSQLIYELEEVLSNSGHVSNNMYWNAIKAELKEAAKLQQEIFPQKQQLDAFRDYANFYDSLIGTPCLEGFMKKYLDFFVNKFIPGFQNKQLISLGSGTGLVEEHMIENLGIPKENILGVDISDAMIAISQKRIHAKKGDIARLEEPSESYDIAFSGLNVFQYLPPGNLEKAIQEAARILRPGGYFLGDFISPDHIRWYPNIMYSQDKRTISFRTPKLMEIDGKIYQESEIINVNFAESMFINYSGKHKRFLPPINRIRYFFEKHFGKSVQLFDALSLKPISGEEDSCASTRYVVIAKKGMPRN